MSAKAEYETFPFKMFTRRLDVAGKPGTLLLLLINGRPLSLAPETPYDIELMQRDNCFEVVTLDAWNIGEYKKPTLANAISGRMLPRHSTAHGDIQGEISMVFMTLTDQDDAFPTETMHAGRIHDLNGGGVINFVIDKSEPTGERYCGYRADQILCDM